MLGKIDMKALVHDVLMLVTILVSAHILQKVLADDNDFFDTKSVMTIAMYVAGLAIWHIVVKNLVKKAKMI